MIEIAPATLPIETVTPLKVSEAIRLGCLIVPNQAFGTLFWPSRDDPQAACVVGTFLLMWGDDSSPISSMGQAYLKAQGLDCPIGCLRTWNGGGLYAAFATDGSNTRGTMTHLNDTHRWSRESIASWLEGQGL
jgi:hypothetical protein